MSRLTGLRGQKGSNKKGKKLNANKCKYGSCSEGYSLRIFFPGLTLSKKLTTADKQKLCLY